MVLIGVLKVVLGGEGRGGVGKGLSAVCVCDGMLCLWRKGKECRKERAVGTLAAPWHKLPL